MREFIDFNRDAQASLKAKTRFAPPGSYEQDSVPTDADYRAWLDGLAQRADRVHAPGLSAHAQRAAALAREYLQDVKRVYDDLGKQDPLNSTLPPSAKATAQANHEFDDEMGTLARACPARR